MMRRLHGGFSLLELAIALFVLGFMFAALPLLLSALNGQQSVDPAGEATAAGTHALVGFVVQHDRLPCPDQNDDGYEDCDDSRSGGFPFMTVGLGRPLVNDDGFALHYGVYQSSDVPLVELQSGYMPALLEGTTSSESNALDFCQGLRLGLSAGAVATEIGVSSLDGNNRINPAFLLVDPGATDADGDGSLFDGSNTDGLTFESSEKGQTDSYDDTVVVMGFAELAARLACPQIMARVTAAIGDADAAWDMERSWEIYREFREFDVEVKEANLDLAETKETLAYVNVAIAAAMLTTDTAALVVTPVSAGAIAAYAVTSALAIYQAADEVTSAVEDVAEKEDELAAAETQLTNAQAAEAAAEVYLEDAVDDLLERDARGWFQ